MTPPSGSFPKAVSAFSQIKHKGLQAYRAFSFTEQIIFYTLLTLFTGSTLFLLAKVNEQFTVEVPLTGGTIKEGIVGYPRYINPIISITDTGKDLSLLVYSGLLKATHDGKIIPDLAEHYTISEDGLTYSVTLKENISFHDGHPVTTSDVNFTIKRLLDPELKSPKAPNWKGVEVSVIDEKNIIFTLKSPYSPFIENLTLGILPEHIWKNIDSEGFVFSQFNIEPIGSGPYKITEIKQNKSGLPEYYHFVPFSEYALGKPYIKHFYTYFFTNEEKMLEAWNDGIIDQMNSISPKIAQAIATKKSTFIRTPLPRIFGLFFNQNEAPVFSHKEVRLALNTAVNRKSIIDNVLFGFGTEAYGPLPPTDRVQGNTQDLDTLIQQGQSILEKNAWEKNEDGIYQKKSKTGTILLSFSISTSDTPELKSTAYLLKDIWTKLGASVEVKIFELSDLNQNIIQGRKYDSLLFGQSVGRHNDLFAFWHSSERNDPGLNVSMYTNSKVDKIIDDLRKTTSEEKRVQLYDTFEKEITNDIPAVFIYSPDFIYITHKNVKGIAMEGIVSASERFLNIHKWYTDTQKIWNIFNQ